MAVNLRAAHKKTGSCAAHKVLLACFLQSCSTQRWISCSTQRWISCSARNRARVLYMKDNSRVTSEFGPSNSTKIQHTRVTARECQLRNELYRMYVVHSYVANLIVQCCRWLITNLYISMYVCTYIHTI